MDEGDDNLFTFVTYLVAAIERTLPAACPNITASLYGVDLPAPDDLAKMLLADLARLPQRLTLVLDDYHHIHSSAIHRFVASVLRRRPPLLHLVITARALPPLTRARLRAAGEVTELDATQLAFSQDEASRLLETLAGRSIDAAAVESFQAQTEGWVVGLRLLAACSADRGARPLPGRERRSQQLLFDFLIQADHVQGCGFALINLARIYRWQGRLAETELLLENVLAERGLHPDALTLRLLNALTLHHVYTMKLDRAEQTGQLYLALAQESGLKLSQGFAHSVLGCVACLRNQVEQADSQFSILLLKTTPSVSGIVVWLRICRPPAIRAQAGGTCAPARLATCLVDSLETRR